jgi:hypothetical protein
MPCIWELNLGFRKLISWLAEKLLVSKQGLCSTEFKTPRVCFFLRLADKVLHFRKRDLILIFTSKETV